MDITNNRWESVDGKLLKENVTGWDNSSKTNLTRFLLKQDDAVPTRIDTGAQAQSLVQNTP